MTASGVVSVLTATEIGAFVYVWPDGTPEVFDRGWAMIAAVGSRELRVRHGLGRRTAYGRDRVRSVTWVQLQPTVEGVESDDYPVTHTLLSGIRVSKSFLRPGDEVPADYARFDVVNQSEHIDAPHTRRILAVKLREDAVADWATLALLRARDWNRIPADRQRRRLAPQRSTSAPTSVPPDSADQKRAVVDALLAFGATLDPARTQVPAQFTSIVEADELLRSDPFAFLLAVICDQGITAERAWEAPFLLKQRLGHLSPHRMMVEGDLVRSAVQLTPRLHRFVEKIPRWLTAAARRVVEVWDGDAGRIWSGAPDARDVYQRFDDFIGVDQKKAAMAVEILARDLAVPIQHMEHGDVAVDIHLRRVFLRTHLAERDNRDHMIEVARQLHPTAPGALDRPTWEIGRTWCSPQIPTCINCPLSEVCPKDIERSAQVVSV